jgi:hypothetical protein
MQVPEGGRRRQDDHVAFLQTIHGILIGVEANELVIVGNLDQFLLIVLQRLMATLQAI